MEEDFSHQDTSFHGQTQLEPHLSPKETEFLPTVVQIPLAEPLILSASPRRRRSSLIKALVIGLLVLILLLTGTGVYAMERPHIPGGSASIHITPDSQHLSKTYTTHVTLGSTDPTLNPIGARRISITTPTKSLTVPATGTQQEPATYASGVLQLGDGNTNSPIPVGEYAIQSNSGVGIAFYVSSPIPDNHAPYIHAQAMKPGPGGNIRTFDVNGWYTFPHAFIFAINRQPFSGGHNGYTITVVSQTDIESATSQLTKQIQSTLPADQAELKSQLASSEQWLDPTTIHCQPSVKANRNPNDQASDVRVTGAMTCSAIAYTPAKLQAYGATLLGKDAYAQWSGSYVLVGQVQEKWYGVLERGKTASFALAVQDLYVFQLSPGVSAHLASLIAGQTQANAQAVLLQQAGVGKVSLQVSGGLGTALPSSPKDTISRSCQDRDKSGKHPCNSAFPFSREHRATNPSPTPRWRNSSFYSFRSSSRRGIQQSVCALP